MYLDNMFPQLLRILDPCFCLEERLFLVTQFQQSAINVEGTEVLFDVIVRIHCCRLVYSARVWRKANIKLRGVEVYR